MQQNTIHPTVIIEGNVKFGSGNVIHPHVVISGNVTIGDNNIIGPSSFITNNVAIGNNNNFSAFASVGSVGEMGTKGDIFLEDGIVRIGDHNIFRETLTIHSPVRQTETLVGSHCYIMNKCHIAHDTQMADYVVMAAGAILSGGITIHRNAFLGVGATIHQRVTIGESAMVGMNAAIVKDIPPFTIAAGVPSKIFGFNKLGAERRGIDEKIIAEVIGDFRNIILGSSSLDNEIARSIVTFHKQHEDMLTSFIS